MPRLRFLAQVALLVEKGRLLTHRLVETQPNLSELGLDFGRVQRELASQVGGHEFPHTLCWASIRTPTRRLSSGSSSPIFGSGPLP